MYPSGSTTVDQMARINITGNVIPMIWFDQIKSSTGKPNTNAILILADIVYWYRPIEVRDERTGHVVGLKKKFAADLLQRRYQDLMDQFGFSKKQVYNALVHLEEMGLIQRVFRNIDVGNRILPNVMFLALNTERLKEITFPNEISSDYGDMNDKGEVSFPEGRDTLTQAEGYPAMQGKTNTENTTEITTKIDPILSIHLEPGTTVANHSEDGSDGRDAHINQEKYMELIRENICYDALVQTDNISDRNMYEEMYLLICDVVCQPGKTIRVGGRNLPGEVVKSRFLKLNMQHLQYAAYAIQNTTSQIGNMRSYLLTTLYHAPTTMTAYWSQKAMHDMSSAESHVYSSA